MNKKLLNEACINIMLSDLSDNDKSDCLLELVSTVSDDDSLAIITEHLAFLNIEIEE